jgi:hypothetical protein
MMEAAGTSETTVNNYFTWQYNPEDKSELYTRRRENLKSHIDLIHSEYTRYSPKLLSRDLFSARLLSSPSSH